MFPVWSLCLNAHSNIDLSLSLSYREKNLEIRGIENFMFIYIFFLLSLYAVTYKYLWLLVMQQYRSLS